MSKKQVLTLAAVFVCLLVVFWLLGKIIKPKSQNSGAGQPAQINPVNSTQVPEGFPQNLPWENGAEILQNFTAKDPTSGKTQSTRAYASKKTASDNFTAYQSFLQNNGWKILASDNRPQGKNLSAAKSGAGIDVSITQDAWGRVMVSVSYIQ